KDSWEVKIKNEKSNRLEHKRADFVFIGAGGGAIPLLQKTGISESEALGGFPISGEFLMCTNEEIVSKHHAKVYGKETKGTPTMSVSTLDRCHIIYNEILIF